MICYLCGAKKGSFIHTLGGWLCLRHLPNMGTRRKVR
jgi:hypothetical protein